MHLRCICNAFAVRLCIIVVVEDIVEDIVCGAPAVRPRYPCGTPAAPLSPPFRPLLSPLGRRCLNSPWRRVTRRSYQPPIPLQQSTTDSQSTTNALQAVALQTTTTDNQPPISAPQAVALQTITIHTRQRDRRGTARAHQTTTTIHHAVDNWSTTDNNHHNTLHCRQLVYYRQQLQPQPQPQPQWRTIDAPRWL